MIVLLALFFSLGAIFYSLEAFKEARAYYNYTLKLYLKQSLDTTNDSLIPMLIQKAQKLYQENPYNPYYEKTLNIEGIKVKILIKDDDKLNINLIKDQKYFNVFKRLSEEFCMPRDFPYYVYYWITGHKEGGINIENLNYMPTFEDMNSKQELIYATPYESFLYKNNCHKKEYKKGIWYSLDTKNQNININTTSIPILKALNKDITNSIANSIIEYRENHIVKNIQELVNVRGLSLDDIYKLQNLASTTSKTMIIKVVSSTKMGSLRQASFLKIYYTPIENKIIGIYKY